MDPEAIRRALESFDPTEIPDPVLRERVCLLSSLTAYLLVEVERLTQEIAALRGERSSAGRGGGGGEKAGRNAGGETGGTPPIPPNRERPKEAPAPPDPSPAEKPGPAVCVERTLEVDPSLLVGPGWRRHGCEDRLIQDLLVIPIQFLFHCERWYSAEQGRTVVAPLPAGYDQGRFGPEAKSFVLQLGHVCRVPQIPLARFLQQAGLDISQSTVSDWLSGERLLSPFHAEAREVFQAGMRATDWIGHDVTSTKINGANWACHGLGNPWFSSFITLPGQDRAHTLRAFQGGKPLLFRLDAVADRELEYQGLSQRVRRRVNAMGREQTWDETEFATLLAKHAAGVSDVVLKKVRDAAALAGFRHRSDCATPRTTLKDDAAAGAGITHEEAICWWHEARHYEALCLPWEWQQQQRARFLRCYWKLYRQVDRYRAHPTPERATTLAGRFDRLFRWKSGSLALDRRLQLTYRKKERLLTALRHPAVPLHNNGLERSLRARARKRDVSYQTRSECGLQAWDTMQSLIQTTQKLGISFGDYLRDRLVGAGTIPRLADTITSRVGAA